MLKLHWNHYISQQKLRLHIQVT